VTYEGDNFWFRGLGGGYYLWNDNADKLSVMAYYDPMHFKPGDSDNNQLRRLDKRKSSMMAGLSYVHNSMVSCVPRWQAIRWITATALSGIWPGCTATPTAD
jgi:outer membrane protein